MKIFLYLCIAGLIFSSCSSSPQQESDKAHEWTYLIKDGSINTWKTQGDVKTEVKDDILEVSGNGGSVFSEQAYSDFLIETEFLIEADKRSGIAFRYGEGTSQESDGYLVKIDHNTDQQNTMGSIVDVSRAKVLKGTKIGGWNKLAIEASSDHLKVFVNDTLVTEVHDRSSDEGLLAVKALGNGSSIKFRNMRIKELPVEDFAGPLLENYMREYAKSELVPLADMTNLDDWAQIGDAKWDLTDGVIHGYSGEKGGFLISKGTYRNFYLKLKFKIKHEDNSGIFIRHSPEDTAVVTTDNGIECNIYDHDGFLHEYSTGAIAPIARAWSKMIDYDEWNDMEIFAFEDQICMFVNGRKSSEAHLSEKFNQKGNICIQGGIQVFNGNLPSEIYIRDLYIKDFEDVPFLGF